MRVQKQILSPCVKRADDPDPGAEMLGIGCHLDQRGGTRIEQQVVETPLVGQGKHIEFMRDSEDDMKVHGREQFLLPCSYPAFTRLCLAFRTVSVSARIIRDGLMAAPRTSIDMAA